ncbi:MAG: glycosyltransferase, partial [Limisphaerales bacterium]
MLTVLLAAVLNRKVQRAAIYPKVSIIIAAYNEEGAIASKIEQTLSLHYPKEQMEIIVASDGSSDRTDDIVRSFCDQGVQLFRVEGRVGKTVTLNRAAAVATGEILVFSDSTGDFNAEAIRELVSNFADPEVGCVSGRVAYRYGIDATSAGFKDYQRLAVLVRRAEGLFGSQTSVSGSIHAMRRELFRPTPAWASPDIFNALHTVLAGKRVVYENSAVAIEASRNGFRD